jgi:hypothetical protein
MLLSSLIIVVSLIMVIIQNVSSLTIFHSKYHPLPPMELTEYNKLLFLRNHYHHYGNDIRYDNIKPKKSIRSIKLKLKNKNKEYHVEYDKAPRTSFYKEKIMDMYNSGLPVHYETIFNPDYGFIQKYTVTENSDNYSMLYQKSTGVLIEYTIEHKDNDIGFLIQNQYLNHDLSHATDYPPTNDNNENNICPSGFPELELDDINFEADDDYEQEYNTLTYLRHQVVDTSLFNEEEYNDEPLFDDEEIENNEKNENNLDNDDLDNDKNDENDEEIENNEKNDDNDLHTLDSFDYDSFLVCCAILVIMTSCSKVIDAVKGNMISERKYENASDKHDPNPFDVTTSKFTSLISTISCPNSPIRIGRSPVRNGDRSPIRLVFNN